MYVLNKLERLLGIALPINVPCLKNNKKKCFVRIIFFIKK